MTIKQYILDKYKKNAKVHNSQTTESVYITLFDEYTIRISGHMPNSGNTHLSDMFILNMANTGKVYTVFFYPNMKPNLMTYKEIVSYIDGVCLMLKLNKDTYTRMAVRSYMNGMKEATQRANYSVGETRRMQTELDGMIKESANVIKQTKKVKEQYQTKLASYFIAMKKINTGGLSAIDYINKNIDDANIRSTSPLYELFFEKKFLVDLPFLAGVDDEWLMRQMRCVFQNDIPYIYIQTYIGSLYEQTPEKKRGEWKKKSNLNDLPSAVLSAWKKEKAKTK